MPGLEILLVTSPGLTQASYEPLIHELREDGAAIAPVTFPCSGDLDSLTDAVARAGEGRRVVVVAHGVGATLALRAADRLEVERWVLIAPVLGVVPGPGLTAVSNLALDRSRVDLAGIPAALGDVWLGAGWEQHATCVAPGLARDIQWWIASSHVPVDPSAIREPVWVELGLLDEIATIEATLPQVRRFPSHELVRPGIGRLDPEDYRHLDLVRSAAPVRLAARAAVEGW